MTARARAGLWLGVATGILTLSVTPALAVLDIEDRGPRLEAGAFAMRITNVGVLGNAFFRHGRSFDPSLEYPRGSGQELLASAQLWVGALTPEGVPRVSGDPVLEWRPSLDPDDRVRMAWYGDPGSRREVDDDGDGRLDEETLDGRDDDGDGNVDEDLGLFSQQLATAEFTDDRPEAIQYVYNTGEAHEPLGLSVHMEAYAWTARGFDGIAGVQFRIRNHGDRTLRDVHVGLLVDLDARLQDDPSGHTNDHLESVTFSREVQRGTATARILNGSMTASCTDRWSRTVPAIVDALPGFPVCAVLPLEHTRDPLVVLAAEYPDMRVPFRAPGGDAFRFTVLRRDLAPGRGGVPTLDLDRHAALRGDCVPAQPADAGDPVVLVSAGPFPALPPGEEIEFAVAFVVAQDLEALASAMSDAVVLHDGLRRNLLPDASGNEARYWYVGETGLNGHEVCIEPPPGVTFLADPHCPIKFDRLAGPAGVPQTDPRPVLYEPGGCIWTDADCDLCTGTRGEETIVRWLDPGALPPVPGQRALPRDHAVRVEWDNTPEILLSAGLISGGGTFAGYRVYRVSDWTRRSALPPLERWATIREFGVDTLRGQTPLAWILDEAVTPDGLLHGQPHYPIGRYRFVDSEVLNGFDHIYVVTTVVEKRVQVGSTTLVEYLESPLTASIDSIVVPQVAARERAGGVWVVPNPYRAHAPWDRPPVPGDPFGRHLDFFGLPRARATIRIYTAAGDFVVEIEHDGNEGDGQASWNLISRNGQEVESGIYLFTVDSRLGHETGRFVVIR